MSGKTERQLAEVNDEANIKSDSSSVSKPDESSSKKNIRNKSKAGVGRLSTTNDPKGVDRIDDNTKDPVDVIENGLEKEQLIEEQRPCDKKLKEFNELDNPESNEPIPIGESINQENHSQPNPEISEFNHEDNNDDDGDPIPSGTGIVSRECSASELIGWSEILPNWHSKLNQRPRGLDILVRNGIPEPLRGEVWQLLSGAQQCSELMDYYRILLTKTAPTEQIILRDVHRTYPAHENFRSNSGSSSLLDSLFKVCKAFAVYDQEVGYCQGLSFLVAALLLHMPEEQAFCVFVRIMSHYGLRDLFRNNFDELYLKFYQLERLLEDNMPDLYQHFSLMGIEPFTYASQWFLTVFTAKFPLNAVFYILDIFLLDGMDTIFQVALALLHSSKQELLELDFEGVLKYFRVQMPKRYRNQENVQQLINASTTISLKKLSKHAKNYEVLKQKERLLENPISRLQRDNAKLTENNLRLEQENDDLARDLVASKIQLRAQLDLLEDKTETLDRALTNSRQDCQSYLNTISDMEDERSRLEVEVSQLKEVCRRELSRAEEKQARDSSIIRDYKNICSQMNNRLDYRLKCAKDFVAVVSTQLLDNEYCVDTKCHKIFFNMACEFLDNITSDLGKTSGQDETTTTTVTDASNSPGRQLARKNIDRKASIESDCANRPVGALLKSALLDSKSTSSEVKIKQLTEHVDELEVELARTKLALVEAECKCQQLTHDLNAGLTAKVSSGCSNQQSSGLSGKFDFVRAAVSSTARRSPKARHPVTPAKSTNSQASAFSKLNTLISEGISNLGQNYHSSSSGIGSTSSMPISSSSPSLANSAYGENKLISAKNNNNVNETVACTIFEGN